MNLIAGWLSLFLYLAFAFPAWKSFLNRLRARLGDWIVGFLLLPYLLAVGFRPAWGDLLRIVIFMALPTLLLRLRPRRAKSLDLFHALTILALWIPIEPSLFVLGLDLITPGVDLHTPLANLRLLPDVEATLVPGVTLPVATIVAVCLALYLFLVRHPLEGIGFTFHLKWHDLKFALFGLLAYGLVGLPIGLGMSFLRFNPTTPGMSDLLGGILGGYLLVALIEEVLFRGVIQNLLSRRLKKVYIALPMAAIIFGLAHLNNATQGFPVPNWAYVFMATLAGLVYGWVWQRTGKVTASALTHMLVNLIWGILFH
jgi:membrane protease YdiL (CAAX protease family)